MATTYNVNYHLTNCEEQSWTGHTYINDGDTILSVGVVAVEGTKFVPNDSNCYYYRTKSGEVVTSQISLSYVSSSYYNDVKNGTSAGITADGKYLCWRIRMGATNTSDMEVFLSTQGTPVVKTLTINNNVANTSASYETSGDNFAVTLQANQLGTFDTPPICTYGTTSIEMNVSGNKATCSVPTSVTECTITGTFTPKTLTISNEITGGTTQASYTNDGTNFNIVVTGGETGMFNNAPKILYRNSYAELVQTEMTLTDSHTATFSVLVSTNSEVTITGSYDIVIPTLDITNEVDNTNASYTTSGGYFVVTLQGTSDGTFTETPVCSYNGTSVEMEISGNKATCSVPTSVTECTITGTFTPTKEVVPVKTSLENCYIDPEITSVEKGGTLQTTLKANDGYQLKTANLVWVGNESHSVSIDLSTGEINFSLPSDCISIGIVATAEIIAPVGTNYGAIYVYLVTLDILNEFSKKRFFDEIETDSGTGTAFLKEINLGTYVERLKRVYVNIPVMGTDVIKCGNYNTGIKCQAPTTDIVSVDFGEVAITGLNGDAHDFTGTIRLLLPFNGFVDIGNEYFGKTIHVELKANIVTGDGMYIISYDSTPFKFQPVTISRDVIYRTGNTDLQLIGGTEWNENEMYGFEPYLLVENTETKDIPQNAAQVTGDISGFSGFARFDNVDVSGVDCLQEEKDTIKTYLQSGVIL